MIIRASSHNSGPSKNKLSVKQRFELYVAGELRVNTMEARYPRFFAPDPLFVEWLCKDNISQCYLPYNTRGSVGVTCKCPMTSELGTPMKICSSGILQVLGVSTGCKNISGPASIGSKAQDFASVII